MSNIKEALGFLENEIGEKEKRAILSFEEYSELITREPEKVLRNIFQMFYDMVKIYVGKGVDEYPGDPESIGFIKYDCSKLFIEGADNPFFADRLFANRFMAQVESLRQGFQQNRMYIYEGPSGCGKSTFLNNLLGTFEAYTKTKEGQIFEILWEIDEKLYSKDAENPQKLIVSCPSHDYPILIIPKDYRKQFFDRLWPKGRPEIFKEKDYEWLFRGEACTICKAIFESSLEKLGSLSMVLNMAKVRTYKFNRRVGEGVSIFNPGDRPPWGQIDGRPIGGFSVNKEIQDALDKIFGPNTVRYIHSPLARTNNGIYALMDVKLHNEERLRELHNVISEGVHKVGDIEEHINSLFLALMNPEDEKIFEEMKSLKGRVRPNKIPFVLEPAAELNIYRSVLGETIDKYFLPGVFENFVKVVIASRMNTDSRALKEWISNITKYSKYCDENGLLLRMSIFSGIIPDWLEEEDKKSFTAPVRREVISEGENEGDHGFDGRASIDLFKEFLSRYGKKPNLINMDNVADFFKNRIKKDSRDAIPRNFLASLMNSYDYSVFNKVKESLYFYNKEQIKRDILNYLCAVNYDIGNKIKCKYTSQELEVTIDFLKLMASQINGRTMWDNEALKCAQETQKRYGAVTARERVDITETDLYRDLFNSYTRNLKEKALQPFIGNKSFRDAVKFFGTEDFKSFDARIKEHIIYMMNSLVQKFGYTEQGAKEICLYVLDQDLVKKFSK